MYGKYVLCILYYIIRKALQCPWYTWTIVCINIAYYYLFPALAKCVNTTANNIECTIFYVEAVV